MQCERCRGEQFTNAGRDHQGRQRYQCKACVRRWRPDGPSTSSSESHEVKPWYTLQPVPGAVLADVPHAPSVSRPSLRHRPLREPGARPKHASERLTL